MISEIFLYENILGKIVDKVHVTAIVDIPQGCINLGLPYILKITPNKTQHTRSDILKLNDRSPAGTAAVFHNGCDKGLPQLLELPRIVDSIRQNRGQDNISSPRSNSLAVAFTDALQAVPLIRCENLVRGMSQLLRPTEPPCVQLSVTKPFDPATFFQLSNSIFVDNF
eukprot:TRINITY_DN5588_c0_g1_i3.p1 TRINITY_DN5588_c0_g1~~TRINITY_DN5588_c0_g1_i3.p1  ORF type:complete len:168 (+),score=16.68 TRINITY_DN5588_c0_g1_i3:609-1112(+)